MPLGTDDPVLDDGGRGSCSVADRAAGGGAAVASSWAAPRWPVGVSGAAADRAAMDAGHVAKVTGTARRRRRRALDPIEACSASCVSVAFR